MQSFRKSSAPAQPVPTLSVTVPVHLALVAGTLPLLAAIAGSRLFANSLIEMGKASEELFRGDRLPLRPLMKSADKS